MKTAVLLPGHLRSFGFNFPNQYWMLYRHLQNPTFFVSCVDDEDAESIEVLTNFYPAEQVRFENIKQPESLPEPHSTSGFHAPYPRSPTRQEGVTSDQGLCRGLWHLSRIWDFFCEQAGSTTYDVFLLSRGDYHIRYFRMPASEPWLRECFVPWYGNYGGAMGFGFFGAAAMQAYLKTWDKREELLARGCPFHPEVIVGAAMEMAGITIRRTLAVELRKTEKPVLGEDGKWTQKQHVSEPFEHEMAEFSAALARGERGTPYANLVHTHA